MNTDSGVHEHLHHSDRGVQHVCGEYVARLTQAGIQPSTSRPGCPWDNVMAESFMRTLKREEVDGTASRAAAKTRRLIGRFIKVVCAARPFLEFFAATIRNTRQAYLTAVGRFFAWCGRNQLGQIADIEPLRVVAYIEALGEDFAKPTIKQHLAAVRMLFEWLVTGGILATDPPMPSAARSTWSCGRSDAAELSCLG
jgi:hypothetical protein